MKLTPFTDLISLMYPNLCLVCGENLLKNEHQLCLACLNEIPKTNYHLLVNNPIEKKFWGKVKETANKVEQKAKQVEHKVEEKAKEVGKKIGNDILRYNPVSLAVRGGFLLAMKINLLDMAAKIYPALP